MNDSELARLLACTLHSLGGSWVISQELLDNMKPVRLLLDNQSEPGVIYMKILDNEIVIGEVQETEDAIELSGEQEVLDQEMSE
jgi:hypothetical protein